MVLELHYIFMIGFWLQKSALKIEDKGKAVVFIKSRTNTDRRRQRSSGSLCYENNGFSLQHELMKQFMFVSKKVLIQNTMDEMLQR